MRGIVIVYKGVRITRRLPDNQIEEFMELATARLPGAEIHTHSLLEPAMPPDSFSRRGRFLWCPYCGKPQTFWLDEIMELVRCPICYISDRDFYVRKANRLDDLKGYIIDAIRKGREQRQQKAPAQPKEPKPKPAYTRKLKKVRQVK